MNHGLCWKMGEQMGWIRKDFVEQLYLGSPTLMLGQFEVSFSRMTVNIRDQNKPVWPHSVLAISQLMGCVSDACHGELESSPESHHAATSLPSDMSIRGIAGLAPTCLRFMLPQDVHLKYESHPSHQRRKVLNWKRSIIHIPPGIHILII